ncbi:MAG: prolipoprotein diacylglyceryl transferase [Candidatus Aminicenantes bacterium]|nr:MAG: prolipoprotein diacylglyceryl transferase [Candidatus Aminicenantes bacterium]
MHPILVKIGPITIHTYGFMLAVGVLCAIGLSTWLAKREHLDTKRIVDFIFYTLLIGLVGAKLFLLVTDFSYYTRSFSNFKSLIFSGGTFYGGLIIGVFFAAWYLRKHKISFKVMADIVVPSIALAQFFGRLGCFSAGCCWGRQAQGCPIAVVFTSSDTTTGVPLHAPLYPTQLMEAGLNLLNFIILIISYKKKKFQGQIFAMYIFNYSLIRFFVEFFRGDDDRGYIFGGMAHPFTSLSVPQLISIIGIIAAIILYIRFKKTATK